MWKSVLWTGSPWAGPPPAGSGDDPSPEASPPAGPTLLTWRVIFSVLSSVHCYECTEEAPLCILYSAIPEKDNGTLLLTQAHGACADKIHHHPQQ